MCIYDREGKGERERKLWVELSGLVVVFDELWRKKKERPIALAPEREVNKPKNGEPFSLIF
jgi:hypothetical protein